MPNIQSATAVRSVEQDNQLGVDGSQFGFSG